MLAATKLLLWQAYFCCDPRHILSWQTHVCRNKSKLVTKLLSRQNYMFVVTKMILVAAPANYKIREVSGRISEWSNGQHFSLFLVCLAGRALWPADLHAGVPRRHQERGHYHQHPHAEENQSVTSCSHERWWDGGTGSVRFFVSALLVQLVGFFGFCFVFTWVISHEGLFIGLLLLYA